MRSSIDDNESFVEAAGSLRFNNPPTDPNTLQQELVGSSGMQPQEWSEDGCFNNPSLPNVLNTIRGMGSSSSIVMQPTLSELELEKPKYVFDIFSNIPGRVSAAFYRSQPNVFKLSLFNKGLALFQWKQDIISTKGRT